MALTATDLFNDATTRMVGGIGPDQVDKIVADLTAVQQMLSAASPQINNLSDLHTHIIIEQLNEEIASVQGTTSATGTPILGTDLGQFVGRSINDIHRDIIDIAQGDAGVQAIFNPTPLPDLATSPVPFHDNAEQTAFLTQFIQDSSHLGQMATTIANDGFQGDVAGLLQQIETFATNASAFDQSQGGLYSARFWNELRSDGTAGTAANALIEGLQTHNAGEVSAAAEQLATNASDLATNNIKVDGGTYDDVVAAAQISTVTATAASTPAPTSTSASAVISTLPSQSTAPAAIADADAGHHAPIDPTGLHDQHSPAAEMAHQFHHMWG
jgi:trimeric autotransporter adhesin